MTDATQRVAEALTGLHVDPAQSVCGCYELTPEDARELAQAAIDALTDKRHLIQYATCGKGCELNMPEDTPHPQAWTCGHGSRFTWGGP